jgi:hypothetical protein
MSWNGPISDIVSVCFDKTYWYYSGAWPFHDKTYWYYVWGPTISWQHRLILCLGLDHFNIQISDIVSVCFGMKWSSPRHSIILFCHEMVKSQTYYQSVLSWNGQAPDIVSVCYDDTMSGAWPFHAKTEWYYVWDLNISWQNRLILCLGLDHFMTKQTDTMSGARPFHVSVCVVMKCSSPRYSISLFCHEIFTSQT